MIEKILYVVMMIILLIGALSFLNETIDNPRRRLEFIKKAQRDNRIAIGKLSSLTLEGDGIPEYYAAEYAYVVNEKVYYVTYKMAYTVPKYKDKEHIDADDALLFIKNALILYFDEKDPADVFCKQEIFCTSENFKKTRTPKHNKYRNVEKMWTEAIDLVR